MGTLGIAALALLSGALALAGPGAGQAPEHMELTFKASKDCDEGRALCLKATDGDPAAVGPGTHLMVTFINEDAQAHNLYVTTVAQRDAERADTDGDRAFARSAASVPPGGMDELDGAIPDEAQGVYFWCDMAGHEAAGMWWEESFGGATTLGNDEPADLEEVSPTGAPAAAWTAVLAAALLAALARRPR